MELKEIILPEIDTKTKLYLSPFTWNNLKIPPLNPTHPSKPKSFSQKKTKPLQKPNESIHLKTIKEVPKQQKDHKQTHHKRQHHKPHADERLSMHTATQSLHPRIDTQGHYRQRHRMQKINKTIQVIKSEQTKAEGPPKRIRFLDDRNNMERYLKNNLQRIGWAQSTKQADAEPNLLWSNIDKLGDHGRLKGGQYYNHVSGSYNLTNKDKLHQALSGKPYYPTSFLIPQEYPEFTRHNNSIAVKCMLRALAREIEQFINLQPNEALMEVTLPEVLESSIVKLGNEDTSMLAKMCIFLEELRRRQGYSGYFQAFQSYKQVNIAHKDHFYDQIVQKAIPYLEGNKLQYLRVEYKDVDYRLLLLILHYHRMLMHYDHSYPSQTYIWIIKPIASSRGAGISLARASKEYCTNPQNLWSEFKNRKKYENKIIQHYLPQPYLLTKTPLFANRKFDIRQWVLVTAFKNKPIIYKYHTAYCRFAHEPYSTAKLNKEVHLTNYSIFKSVQSKGGASIMMLEDFLGEALGDLRSKYSQQVDHIITDAILSTHIKYQDGCFELFGFDLLIDAAEKVHLLEVNLNPACDSQRHPKLKQESEVMTKTMISLVTECKPSEKWVKLYGASNNIESSADIGGKVEGGEQLEIKPYYSYQLSEEESLIGLVRYRGRVISRMFALCQAYLSRKVLRVLRGQEWEEEGEARMIRFIEEKSVSNI